MILSLGSRLVREGEEAAKPPDDIVKMLVEHGENGIIIDGIIAWIAMNTDMTADNILKQLLEKSVDLTEVLKSREVLKTAGGTVLAENHRDINQKTRTKIELAVKDVVEGVKILKEKKKMPLVLAAPDQWRRCPGAGLTSKTAPGPELPEASSPTISPAHWSSDIAEVPESVSKSMYTSSLRSRKVLYPASRMAAERSSWLSIRIGSTILIFQGSAQERRPNC